MVDFRVWFKFIAVFVETLLWIWLIVVKEYVETDFLKFADILLWNV